MLPDYYLILGVSRSATQIEIKVAYRNLAKLHHPDKHGGDPVKNSLLKEINEAYSVLSHTDTKFAYDKQFIWQEEYQSRPQAPYTSPPPYYAPKQEPYNYAPRKTSYASTKYVYSKWTLMYGKIFIIALIMFVVLFPILLEFISSNYYYNKGLVALANNEFYEAEGYFRDAMRDLGGSNTLASIKGAELKIAFNSNFEALTYVGAGLNFADNSVDRARLYYLQGLANRNLNRMSEAEFSLQEAIRWRYNSDSVYTALAPIYAYQLKNYDKALASYDSLINHDSSNYDNYLNRGFCFQKLNLHNKAITDFNNFIYNKGTNGSVLYLKAISEVSLNELDSACINFHLSEEMGIVNARTFIKLYCELDSVKTNYPTNPF